MRRVIAFALIVGLLGALSASPAIAKKKKKAKPVTFEASGSFAIGNPGHFGADVSLVATEFTNTCAIPATQGTDGFVVELSDEISKAPATVSVSGSDATGLYDLDMYFFNAECSPVGAASTEVSDEVGVFAAGTKYIIVSSFMGAEIEFELSATQI